MPLDNRKRKKIFQFWERFSQNKNSENKYLQAKIWKASLENMEDKIVGFQFDPVSTKPTR